MSKAVFTFTVTAENGASRTETISQDIIKVGKDPKSHLLVEDELASRMHAVIEVGGADDISIIDLGNEPSTQVNGAPINKAKLNAGDSVLVGKTTIKLEKVDAAGAQAAWWCASRRLLRTLQRAALLRTLRSGWRGRCLFESVRGSCRCGLLFSFFESFCSSLCSEQPFGAAPSGGKYDVPDDAAPGTYTYEMVQSVSTSPRMRWSFLVFLLSRSWLAGAATFCTFLLEPRSLFLRG